MAPRPAIGEQLRGTVKRIVPERAFGFIRADDSADEFFFHSSSCTGVRFDELREGTRVTFVVGISTKGPRAEEVCLASEFQTDSARKSR